MSEAMLVNPSGKGDSWKLLFTLELDIEEGRYRLGGFMCFQWPEAYRQPNGEGEKALAATLVLLAAAGVDPDTVPGLPNEKQIQKFLSYTSLRAMFDNKATDPMVLDSPVQLTVEQMRQIVDSTDHATLKLWRKTLKVEYQNPLITEGRPRKKRR